MAIAEQTLFGKTDKVAMAIKRMKEYEEVALQANHNGYWLAFSGGKDSIVLKDLAIKSGVKFHAHYNVSTIDPPELIYFIRKHHGDVAWERPEKCMPAKMLDKGFPPLRQGRWCCELYKEGGGAGFVMLGIRWAESHKRSKRRMVEVCRRDKSKTYFSPIIDWSDADIWEYIKSINLPYCCLYDEGWHRLGCIACPFANKKERRKELDRWPGFEKLWRIYFRRLYKQRKAEGKPIENWKDGDEWFDWWVNPPESVWHDSEEQQCFSFDN